MASWQAPASSRPADVVDFWFQSRVLAKYTTAARAGAFGVVAIVRLALVASAAPLVAFAWAVLLETALAGVLLLLLYLKQEGWPLHWRVDPVTARALLRVSWPLALSSVAVWLYMRVDQLMIGWMLDEASVGVYSVAVRLAEVWYFVPSVVVSSVFAALLRARESDPVRYRARVQALFTGLVLLGYVTAMATSLVARPVVLYCTARPTRRRGQASPCSRGRACSSRSALRARHGSWRRA